MKIIFLVLFLTYLNSCCLVKQVKTTDDAKPCNEFKEGSETFQLSLLQDEFSFYIVFNNLMESSIFINLYEIKVYDYENKLMWTPDKGTHVNFQTNFDRYIEIINIDKTTDLPAIHTPFIRLKEEKKYKIFFIDHQESEYEFEFILRNNKVRIISQSIVPKSAKR